MLLVTGTMAGCLSDDGDNGGDGDGDEEVLANAGENIIGRVGEPVTFNASLSSGPIVKYWWDVDLGNASTPLSEDLVGEEAQYTYSMAGKYVVTLTVEGEGDRNDTDTVSVFVDLVEEIDGTISLTDRNETYEYSVTDDVLAIRLKLTYPTGTILNPYTLDMEVYVGDPQPVATTASQPPDQGDTQVEELDLTLMPITENEGFELVVHWTTAPTDGVEFDLKVEILYSSS